MSVQSELNRFVALQQTIGKRALNALFPNDFEIYIFALEIVNGNDDTEDYFIFPVNPSSVSETKSSIQSIKKTAGGLTVLNSTTFVPSNITMQGSFGRKFKFLSGNEIINFSAISFRPSLSLEKPSFNKNIKTGYGCIKLVEAIIEKSNSIDQKTGKPYALYFHNLALGNSYLVKTLNYNFYQNQGTNIIWNYNLTFQSLARVEDIAKKKSKKSLTASLSATSAIQNRVNSAGNGIGNLLKNTIVPTIVGSIDKRVGSLTKFI